MIYVSFTTDDQERTKSVSENTPHDLVLDQNIDVKCRFSLEGTYLQVSPNCEYLLGYTEQELIDQNYQDFIHPVDLKKLHMQLEKMNDSIETFSFRIQHKDGHYIWMETTVAFIPHPETKQYVEAIAVARDISHRKKTEQHMMESEKLSVTGQLAAGIAHEIRNPLTSLKGFLQLLKMDNDHRDDFFKIMEAELTKIETISNELMVLAKPKQTDFKFHRLQSLLEHVIMLLDSEAFRHSIQIEQELTEESLYVYCDDTKCKQVFLNILKNAIEAIEQDGKINVKVFKEDEHTAVIEVKDNGCGIPKHLLKKLGSPFFTTKKTGNGLGLMVCYKIIEQQNGSISIESEPNEGSTFTIRLPLYMA
ncbi:hypothetical protein A3863_04015 [Priestia endophytica]|uniref:histidine kinase n=2 Tax=Priestia endophytica TaxID=135735 RepID=A0AAX1Q192_9BACI|nr:PAS domain S-box protein [Priestia endophytica]RAS71815.1 hypothetical protein A3864_22280 [Priestia endophytica]RAS84700.1 hypothetical protein A4R27_05000 [Priestia endophytica]RAS91940.1 hypothetical protein A3863_04015 [Priestia endophytica]